MCYLGTLLSDEKYCDWLEAEPIENFDWKSNTKADLPSAFKRIEPLLKTNEKSNTQPSSGTLAVMRGKGNCGIYIYIKQKHSTKGWGGEVMLNVVRNATLLS